MRTLLMTFLLLVLTNGVTYIVTKKLSTKNIPKVVSATQEKQDTNSSSLLASEPFQERPLKLDIEPTDSIQIIYDTESDTIDMTVMLQTLMSIIANPGIRDKTQNADRVTLVGGSTTISSGTINNVLEMRGYQAHIPLLS